MIAIQVEFCSEWRCLLGIFFQKGSEMLDDERREFSEVAIGLVFFYFRIAKYKKKES